MAILMRRPTRTRRLSIAAIASLLAFVVAAGFTVRSFWMVNGWIDKSGQFIALDAGLLTYTHVSATDFFPSGHVWHIWNSSRPNRQALGDAIFGFRAGKSYTSEEPGNVTQFTIAVPMWSILLLLLVAPARLLIARSANAPAFPVIADAKQSK